MQGTAIAGLAVAMGNLEAAETASGPGLRMSSKQQSATKNTLFTEILNHKGEAVEAAGAGFLDTENPDSAEESDDGYGGNSDVCGLLMQMLIMNNAANGQSGGQNTAEPVMVNTNAAIANLTAADVTIQSTEIPTAPELQGTAEATDETVIGKQDTLGTFGARIMEAMAKAAQTEGQSTAEGGIGASQHQEADPNSATAGQGQTQPAANPEAAAAEAASLPNMFGQAVRGAAQNGGLKNGQTGAIEQLKEQTKETGMNPSGGLTNSIETAEDGAPAVVRATSGDQADGGTGELLSDDDTGGALGREESGAAILNRTFTNTSYGGVDPAEATAAVEKAFQTFADDVKGLEAGVSEIKIVLEPESLGTMIITVMRTENGISAKIKANDKQVCQAISDQIHKLISSLEARGIQVEDVDVSYSQTEQNTGFDQQGFTGGRQETAREQHLPYNGGNKGEEPGGQETVGASGEADTSASIKNDTLMEYRL